MTDSLQKFKDELSIAATGITKAEAHSKGICIECKQDWKPKTHSEAGYREYKISGICEDCFDEMFADPDEGNSSLGE